MSRLLALLVLLVGCGEDALTSDKGAHCPGNAASVELWVEPQPLLRGASTLLALRWTLTQALASASATLTVHGVDEVSLVLPLAPTDEAGVYAGETLNPFGTGAPAGSLEVLAQGTGGGCLEAATAATSVTLE